MNDVFLLLSPVNIIIFESGDSGTSTSTSEYDSSPHVSTKKKKKKTETEKSPFTERHTAPSSKSPTMVDLTSVSIAARILRDSGTENVSCADDDIVQYVYV